MSRRRITLATARAHYTHRYTLEHVPAWAKSACSNGKFYAPGFRSDQEWYDNTTFPGEAGLAANSKHCETHNQSWPFGQWLNKACPVFAYLAVSDDAKLAAMRADLEWKA